MYICSADTQGSVHSYVQIFPKGNELETVTSAISVSFYSTTILIIRLEILNFAYCILEILYFENF